MLLADPHGRKASDAAKLDHARIAQIDFCLSCDLIVRVSRRTAFAEFHQFLRVGVLGIDCIPRNTYEFYGVMQVLSASC